MKVQKIGKAPEPGYPNRRQFAECKALIGIAAMGLSTMALEGCRPRVRGITASLASLSTVAMVEPASKSEQPNRLRGDIAIEPRPTLPITHPSPPKQNPPRVKGQIPVDPPVPAPVPPAK